MARTTTDRPPLRRLLLALLALLLALALPGAAPAAAARGRTVVALGDSVPAGSACRCVAFPELYGALLAGPGAPVTVRNDAVGGETTASELRRLRDPAVRRDLRAATTVVVMVGANDYAGPFAAQRRGDCRGWACYDTVRRQVRTRVTTLVRQVRALHPGVHVVVLGYWDVVRDGAVGLRDYGAHGLAVARAATVDADRTLLAVARAEGATYVSTRVALRGTHDQVDPTPYLAADGDHPSARGHRRIARAVLAAAPAG